jgi:molecular chaperone IbpA
MRISEREVGNYPPYNIVKHGADQFSIELAVAGFKQGDIEVTLEKNQLTINGKQAVQLADGNQTPSTDEFLFRGISSKNFSRVFTLAEHVSVIGASTTDGILTIQLERKIPEEAKTKTIPITYSK